MSFGRRFRALREAARLTQTDIARRSGLYAGDISRIESGRREPKEGTMDRLLASVDLDEAERLLKRHQAVIAAERVRQERGASP